MQGTTIVSDMYKFLNENKYIPLIDTILPQAQCASAANIVYTLCRTSVENGKLRGINTTLFFSSF